MASFNLAASNIGWHPNDDIKVFSLMSELGYTGLEIAPTRIVEEQPYSQIDAAKAFLDDVHREYGLKVCSMQSIWRGQTGNIFNPVDANGLMELNRRVFEYADSIGCPNIVFGCPRNRCLGENDSIDDAISFFIQSGDMASSHHTVLAIEPNPVLYGTNFLNKTEEVVSFLRKLDYSTGLALNLDFGTIVYNDEDIDVLTSIVPLVNHVHISEPSLAPIKQRESHRRLKEILVNGSYRGYVSVEMAYSDFNIVEGCLRYVAEVFNGA